MYNTLCLQYYWLSYSINIEIETNHQHREESSNSEALHSLGRVGDVVEVPLEVGLVYLGHVAVVGDPEDGVGASAPDGQAVQVAGCEHRRLRVFGDNWAVSEYIIIFPHRQSHLEIYFKM